MVVTLDRCRQYFEKHAHCTLHTFKSNMLDCVVLRYASVQRHIARAGWCSLRPQAPRVPVLKLPSLSAKLSTMTHTDSILLNTLKVDFPARKQIGIASQTDISMSVAAREQLHKVQTCTATQLFSATAVLLSLGPIPGFHRKLCPSMYNTHCAMPSQKNGVCYVLKNVKKFTLNLA